MVLNTRDPITNRTVYAVFIIVLVIVGFSGTTGLADIKKTAQPGDKFNVIVNNQAGMPEPELEILRQQLQVKLQNQGLLGKDVNKQLHTTVIKFRFRKESTRILTGTLTGTDAIVSNVVVKNTADGKTLGEKKIATQNPTVISKPRNLIERHIDKIVSRLSK